MIGARDRAGCRGGGYARFAMEVAEFVGQSRVLVVAGKGGVGKTTVAAALARLAAEAGARVVLVDLEGRPGLPRCFGRPDPLGYEPVRLHPGAAPDPGSGGSGNGTGSVLPKPGEVVARRITPDEALVEYLVEHGLKRVSRRLVSSGALEIVATAIPGIRDVLVLGKVKQIERQDVADLIVLDAPATGHAMTFLSSAEGLLDAARSGPVRAQAAEVVELLADPRRCQVVLVTLPEEMPVNEVVEAAYALEDRVGVALGPVVVNGCVPAPAGLQVDPATAAAAAGVTLEPVQIQALAAAAAFERRRAALQAAQRARLADALPLACLPLPELPVDQIGPVELGELVDALRVGIAQLPPGGAPATVGPPAGGPADPSPKRRSRP